MRQERTIMGMPVQLEIVDTVKLSAYEQIFDYFTHVDERFSTYKDTSEIAKINRGELSESEYSDEMKEVLALAQETTEITDGYFNIKTPEGTIDPSGLVKGWAINNAASMLYEQGFRNFYVEIAGDIQSYGKNAEGNEWSIGIRNPFKHDEIVKVIYPKGKGVATSGTAARGTHIYNPHTGTNGPYDFVSLTVLGPTVYEADRYATPAFIMGKEGLLMLEDFPDFEAYAIDAHGIAVMTSGFENYLTA